MKSLLQLGILATLFSVGHRASALPRLIDFTDSAWAAAEGQLSYAVTYGSMTVQLNSLMAGRPLTFNAGGPAGPSYLNRDGSGIGILDDEITYIPGDQDLLEVKFSEPVTVTSLYFFKFGTQESGTSKLWEKRAEHDPRIQWQCQRLRRFLRDSQSLLLMTSISPPILVDIPWRPSAWTGTSLPKP